MPIPPASRQARQPRPKSATQNDVYAVLPGGCAYKPFAGAAYYQCGLTWFEPSYGANGVFYRVVPTP
jgi:hypothetical protein